MSHTTLKEFCLEMMLGRIQSVCGETWLRIMYKRGTASKWPTSLYRRHLVKTIHPFLRFVTNLKPLLLRYSSVLFSFNFQITLDIIAVHHCKIIILMKSSWFLRLLSIFLWERSEVPPKALLLSLCFVKSISYYFFLVTGYKNSSGLVKNF